MKFQIVLMESLFVVFHYLTLYSKCEIVLDIANIVKVSEPLKTSL